MMVGSAVEYNIYQQFQIKNGLEITSTDRSKNEDVKHKLEEEDST